MQQQDQVVMAFPLFGALVLLVGIGLLIYLAVKRSKRSVVAILGAGVIVLFFFFFIISLDVGFVDKSLSSARISHSGLGLEEGSSFDTEKSTLNKELWDRLTEPQIKMDSKQTDKLADLEEDRTQTAEINEVDDTAAKQTVETKPDWVENPPKRMGNVFRRVVSSGPYKTVDECHLVLEDQLREAVRERVQTLVAEGAGESITIPEPSSFGIGLDYIMRDICQDEFTETLSLTFGDMKKVYVLMEFSPVVETELRTAWRKHERYHRLGLVGTFTAGALGLLATLYGMLKVDTWTRGYYTKRLLLGVPAAIIALAVLLSL